MPAVSCCVHGWLVCLRKHVSAQADVDSQRTEIEFISSGKYTSITWWDIKYATSQSLSFFIGWHTLHSFVILLLSFFCGPRYVCTVCATAYTIHCQRHTHGGTSSKGLWLAALSRCPRFEGVKTTIPSPSEGIVLKANARTGHRFWASSVPIVFFYLSPRRPKQAFPLASAQSVLPETADNWKRKTSASAEEGNIRAKRL